MIGLQHIPAVRILLNGGLSLACFGTLNFLLLLRSTLWRLLLLIAAALTRHDLLFDLL